MGKRRPKGHSREVIIRSPRVALGDRAAQLRVAQTLAQLDWTHWQANYAVLALGSSPDRAEHGRVTLAMDIRLGSEEFTAWIIRSFGSGLRG